MRLDDIVLARASTFFATVAGFSAGFAVLVAFPALGGASVPWRWVGGLAALAVVSLAGFAVVDRPARGRENALLAPPPSNDLAVNAGVWQKLWADAARVDSTVPPLGAHPYWNPHAGGAQGPLSSLAYKGAAERLRASNTDGLDLTTLELLMQDPDRRVRDAASRNREGR